MNTTSKVFELGFARIWLDESQIVRLVYFPGTMVTLKEAKEGGAAIIELCDGKKRPIYVDSRGVKNIDREARLFSVSEEAATPWIKAMAVLTSPVTQVLGELFNRINKPPYPIRLFTSEDEALLYLRNFLVPE